MKKKLGVFILTFILCSIICLNNLDQVVLKYAKTSVEKVETAVQKTEEIPTLKEAMNLYLGEKRYIDVVHVGGASKVSFHSDDPSVAAVSKNGLLVAKNCGQTNVTVRMRKGKLLSQAKIKIVVSYSSFYSSPDYGKKITVDASNTKAPVIFFHKKLRVGETTQMTIDNTAKDAVLDGMLNPTDVVSVSKTGQVKALKTGTAMLRMSVKQENHQYVFCEIYHVTNEKQTAKMTDAQLKQWFSDAGFLGNSISVGWANYLGSGKDEILGDCPVMAKGCYSFANELSSSYQYKVTYKGTAYKADEAVKLSGVKKIFINMGANDIGFGPEKTYEQYKAYIAKIKQTNPDVVVYIQAMTPVYKPKATGRFGMDKVNQFNNLMKSYCESQPDLYYIDIATPMMTSDGTLRKDCVSDGFLHLTYTAYAIWADAVKEQIRTMVVQEQKAEDAVITYEKGKREADYSRALKQVKKLEKGTVRTSYINRLTKAKAKTQGLLSVQAATVKTLKQPKITFAKARNNTVLRIKWKKVEGAKFYRVYRATTKHGKYREVKRTTRLTFLDRNLKQNRKYYYRVRACKTHKTNKYDSKCSYAVGCYTRNVPKVEVFAGDSVMTGLDIYHKIENIQTPGKKYTVAYKGLGTLSFQTKQVFANGTKTGVEQIIAYQPDRLYIKLGMNELAYADLNSMYNNYCDILARIQDESPKTEIVILAVAPSSRNAAIKETGYQRVAQWNDKLRKLAKEFGVHYYDFTGSFQDSDGYLSFRSGDGIHWPPSGYDKFCSKITAYDKRLNHM